MEITPPELRPKSEKHTQSGRLSGFSTFKVLAIVVGTLAIVAMAAGYLLQLHSRLTLAESELRLTRVNEQLLAQELQMEKLLRPELGVEQSVLARIQFIPLHAAPSSWQIQANFFVLWDPETQMGLVIMEGNFENATDHQMEFQLIFDSASHASESITIPTRGNPSAPRRRWFDASSFKDRPISHFELVVRLGEESADVVRFRGDRLFP